MKIEIGELRDCLSLDLQKKATDIIEKKKNDSNYYMMVWSDVDPLNKNQINSKIFTLPESYQPPALIGTFCVYVDNKVGRIKSLWNLPLDVPTRDVTDKDKTEDEAARSGQKMKWAIFNN